MNFVITILFVILFDSFVIKNLLLFVFAFVLGNIGLQFLQQFIAAIISKASSKRNSLTCFVFSNFTPFNSYSIRLTKFTMDGNSISSSIVDILVLICL